MGFGFWITLCWSRTLVAKQGCCCAGLLQAKVHLYSKSTVFISRDLLTALEQGLNWLSAFIVPLMGYTGNTQCIVHIWNRFEPSRATRYIGHAPTKVWEHSTCLGTKHGASPVFVFDWWCCVPWHTWILDSRAAYAAHASTLWDKNKWGVHLYAAYTWNLYYIDIA